ncbi:MAG: DUF2842 domain-containing protein [Allosphingosinicella sp.]|uniref:DUF2842 domain-containing protein n=1 Tax=Allosphingosinicella sp. TaxID=2823234 RepID=UPI00395661F4
MQVDQPNWRNSAGIALILLLIALWSVAVVTVAEMLGELHWTIWVVYYTAAGFLWVLPLKPLLRWMATGRWRG